MPINQQHQLEVLKDILVNHQSDCCGTVSECEQLERLIQSLLANDSVNSDVKAMLNDVYYYSQSGKYSPDLDNHISNNQEQLTQWISGMDNFS
ncbi:MULTISPECIES: YtzH-like family protein [Bacillus]|uniref:YtzH-like family protein n=1 Tax=Bacillus bingmayongensis TaxID=1150157 RepID=A0ABU5JQ62_9BACI|nr:MULTISPECIES: YtzH-like family protein [Bacillus]MBO1581276.1 YtzH-like family protein [Bacillus sp. XF8]MBY0599835.1 YtzH-like family protein [Bacillus bingmayongensis]MDZ5605578.1 YtzH-like family protein [Bacillus pseudomycoides]